jgi:hypothetical protein
MGMQNRHGHRRISVSIRKDPANVSGRGFSDFFLASAFATLQPKSFQGTETIADKGWIIAEKTGYRCMIVSGLVKNKNPLSCKLISINYYKS